MAIKYPSDAAGIIGSVQSTQWQVPSYQTHPAWEGALAVEVDGHFAWSWDETHSPRLKTLWRQRLLLHAGIPVVRVPAFELWAAGAEE